MAKHWSMSLDEIVCARPEWVGGPLYTPRAYGNGGFAKQMSRSSTNSLALAGCYDERRQWY